MLFDGCDDLIIPTASGLEEWAEAFLCQNGKADTYRHVCAVAGQNEILAKRFHLDAAKCRAAGILHDISAVMAPEAMLASAKRMGWTLCAAEEKYPFLLHQRLSALMAADYFGISDPEILNPIGCHTTLRANATEYELALFVADKLAWDGEGTPPFYDRVTRMLEISLHAAAREYIIDMNEHGRVLCPHDDWRAAGAWLDGIPLE